MSKTTGKRGFVRPQVQAQIAPAAPASTNDARWNEAHAAFQAAEDAAEAHDTRVSDIPDSLMTPLHEARDRLLSTPAPNGMALAHKLSVIGRVFHPAWNPRQPGWARRVMEEGDSDAQALLACYFDAMGLSGVEQRDACDGISDTLSELVARFYLTLDAYRRADHEVPGPSFPEEEAQLASYRALLAYEPATLSELAVKAHVLSTDRWDEKQELAVITADVLRLVGAIFGKAAVQAHFNRAFPAPFDAAAWLAEYRALGGSVQIWEGEGQKWFATRLPDQPSERAAAMRLAVVSDAAKMDAVEALLRQEANGGAK